MTAITRRGALLGASAAVAVAGVPTAVAAQGDDIVLLARVDQFHDVYGEWQRVWAKQKAHRAAVEAMPDCPPIAPWRSGIGHFEYLKAHDAYRYCDQSSRLCDQTGALALAIFGSPAETIAGVLGKVCILYIARGDYDDDGVGDAGLDAYQDNKNHPWFGSVIADLERLAGEASS